MNHLSPHVLSASTTGCNCLPFSVSEYCTAKGCVLRTCLHTMSSEPRNFNTRERLLGSTPVAASSNSLNLMGRSRRHLITTSRNWFPPFAFHLPAAHSAYLFR